MRRLGRRHDLERNLRAVLIRGAIVPIDLSVTAIIDCTRAREGHCFFSDADSLKWN